MNKKILVIVSFIGLILITSTVTYADRLEEALKAYLNSSRFDLFGRRYDEIIFNRDYDLYEDLKTIPLQFKKQLWEKRLLVRCYSGL